MHSLSYRLYRDYPSTVMEGIYSLSQLHVCFCQCSSYLSNSTIEFLALRCRPDFILLSLYLCLERSYPPDAMSSDVSIGFSSTADAAQATASGNTSDKSGLSTTNVLIRKAIPATILGLGALIATIVFGVRHWNR
jgi:hypothetical protein